MSQGALLYAAALLPCRGSGLLLIDVLLSLLLLPVFVTIDSSIRHAEQGRVRQLGALSSLAAGLGMAGTTATKGLIGLVIPGLATLVAVLWLGPWREAGIRLVAAVRAYAAMRLVAVTGAVGFYAWLWFQGEESCRPLRGTDMGILDTAYESSFGCLARFLEALRPQNGVSPSEFGRQMRGRHVGVL